MSKQLWRQSSKYLHLYNILLLAKYFHSRTKSAFVLEGIFPTRCTWGGGVPGSTLHGYLSKILTRSCQDLGKILAKIVTRYCQELQDAMVRSYQESHVSKKDLTKKPNMARKILLRSPIWQEKIATNCSISRKSRIRKPIN